MTSRGESSGAELFARYAFPPNVLGYCGPGDVGLTEGLSDPDALGEFSHVVRQFEGAWPYLELIGGLAGLDPLDRRVVEAYWVGNELLDGFDLLSWGNSVDDRFRARAGNDWSAIDSGIADGVPNHAFHVFCVYPWVGLLRSGYADHALDVIDRCRIRWGTVVSSQEGHLIVRSRPLTWDGEALTLGAERVESVAAVAGSDTYESGMTVSLHWDYMCDVLNTRRLRRLEHETARHLAIVNRSRGRLSDVVEA